MKTNPETSPFEKSSASGLILFCSTYYWRLFALSLLLLCTVSFHRIFSVVINPVITEGTVVELVSQKEYISLNYGRIKIKTQIVEFDYAGKRYRIMGGSDEVGATVGRSVNVIFSRYAPQNGAEYSFEGLLDWPLANIFFRIWLLLTGCMLAAARLDSRFNVMSLDFSKLTLTRILFIFGLLIALPFISLHLITLAGIGIVFIIAIFWETKVMEPNEDSIFSKIPNFRVARLSQKNILLIALPILLIPLLSHSKLLMTGARTKAIITNDMIFAKDGHMYRTAIFMIDSTEYKVPVQDLDFDQREMIGHTVPVIYLPSTPDINSLYTFHVLYVNSWLVPTGMALIFLLAWFFATRIPNDDGNMDE